MKKAAGRSFPPTGLLAVIRIRSRAILRGLDRDLAGFYGLSLGQHHFEHAVLHHGLYLVSVDGLGRVELPKVVALAIFAPEHRSVGGVPQKRPSPDGELIPVEIDFHIFHGNTGHISDQNHSL